MPENGILVGKFLENEAIRLKKIQKPLDILSKRL